MDIVPLKGHIVPVPTIQEISPNIEFGDAYTVEIIQRCASQVSKLLDSACPKDPSRPLNHLRRFVKESFLPETLRDAIERERQERKNDDDDNDNNDNDVPLPTIFVLIPPPLPEVAELSALLAPFTPAHAHTKTHTHSHTHTTTLLPTDSNTNNPARERVEENTIPIHHLTIPLQPPVTQHQADQWTSTYWPTSFNAAFPRGIIAPPAKILAVTKTSIAPKAGYYLALACKVAQEAKALKTKKKKRGRGIGVVVVDPALACSSSTSVGNDGEEKEEEKKRYDNAIVAVAGDARYTAPGIVAHTDDNNDDDDDDDNESDNNPDAEGGPEFHAIMRVIEMIAMRRRADTTTTTTAAAAAAAATTTGNNTRPSLTSLESHYLYRPHSTTSSTSTSSSTTTSRILPRSAGGYLCTDLDLYITHEPCLCCSMGILLSRFRAVTFLRRGRLGSGGLASCACPRPLPLPRPVSVSVEQEEGDSHRQKEKEEEDRDVYYGLHWRAELNWRVMCFEFVQEDEDVGDGVEGVEGVEERGGYHA